MVIESPTYIIAGDEALPAVQLGPEPVHVVLLVQHLEDLVLAETQLVVRRRVKVVLGNGLHRERTGL